MKQLTTDLELNDFDPKILLCDYRKNNANLIKALPISPLNVKVQFNDA